jgi:hypothetical protein
MHAGRCVQQVVNLSSNDIKNGMSLEIDNVPFRVTGTLTGLMPTQMRSDPQLDRRCSQAGDVMSSVADSFHPCV